MSELINKIARPEIAALTPYQARGGSLDNILQLDANESPWSPPGTSGPWNRYPEQQPSTLTRRLGDLYGVAEDQLLLTRGADEGIDLLFRATCRAGKDAALITPPTFGLYEIAARIQGVTMIEVPLSETYQVSVAAVIKAAQANPVKLIFLCSPNNPTGNLIAREDVLELAAKRPDQLVIVDEAYVEFADVCSLSACLPDAPNLVVLRTLSKAYALAGARLGTVLANGPVIELLSKVLAPYPLPAPVIAEVSRALAPVNMAIFDNRIAQIKAERERMYEALRSSRHVETLWPSSANFLLMKLKPGSGILQQLRAKAIHLRDFSKLEKGMIRLSIGTPEQNNAVLSVFGFEHHSPPPGREAIVSRQTSETKISAHVSLDTSTPVQIDTGIGFFDHMLEQIARHGGFSLLLNAEGDLHIDDHHTIEDCAIVLGKAINQALGNRAGITRYGFVLPMDEAQARVAIDLSGRPSFRFCAKLPPAGAGDMTSQMVSHFFKTLSQHLGASIQIEVDGENVHHIIEAIFKGFGRALRPALNRSGTRIPSSKGVL